MRALHVVTLAVTMLLVLSWGPWSGESAYGAPRFEVRSLDGSGNNRAHPSWGQAGTAYRRVAPATYADGVGAQAGGPSPRYVSNRVFNDLGQNLFSERRLTQWAWTWGQFMDHTFGLAQDSNESAPIPFDARDPLEAFRNDLGAISFKRDAAAPRTGARGLKRREQINTVSSYIDGWSVYGGTRQRLEWLRTGPFDGNMRNNGAGLLLPSGYLPHASARGDAGAAPTMKPDGMLTGRPQNAVVAGDVRANENMALTAVHTLFAREHNRIVGALPSRLSQERKFQIARRVVGAEQQFITYHEFLPAMGVSLQPYAGYRPDVDASLGNEFATVAYRAHSMIHGEFDITVDADRYTANQLTRLAAMGVSVKRDGSENELTVPLNLAFFHPDLVPDLGLGPILGALSDEAQYKNDEQIDNALRSILFQIPGPGVADPASCFADPGAAGCFHGVVDLGAVDIQRGRDHGIPTYNTLRRAFGLPPKRSFADVTGESTARLRFHRRVDRRASIDDPRILEFSKLVDAKGNLVPLGSDAAKEDAIFGVRRTTLASRLRAIYGSVDRLDAFVGMIAEPHVRGSEFGPLQLAIWRNQFRSLRDGDRFFYLNDPVLSAIRRRYGITYRHTLSELIALNTDTPRSELPADVFFVSGA